MIDRVGYLTRRGIDPCDFKHGTITSRGAIEGIANGQLSNPVINGSHVEDRHEVVVCISPRHRHGVRIGQIRIRVGRRQRRGLVFVDICRGYRIDDRNVIATINRHRDGSGRRSTVTIRQGIGEGIRRTFADSQIFEGSVRVVRHISRTIDRRGSTVRRRRHAGHHQRIVGTGRICVIGHNRCIGYHNGGVFICRGGIVVSGWIEVGNGNGERLLNKIDSSRSGKIAAHIIISHPHGYGVNAVIRIGMASVEARRGANSH